MAQESQEVEGVSTSNSGFEGTSALQIRLETNILLNQIEYFLRGIEPNTYWNKENQTWQERLIESGEPKANKKGIQSILNKCRALINPQVVQGNYDKAGYLRFICEKRIEIARMCFVNFYDWELKYPDNIATITETIMDTVEPFLSRTIDNKERDSYAQTIRTVENNRVESKGGGLNPFNNGG